MTNPVSADKQLLADVRYLIGTARQRVAGAVNAELTQLYWQIGRRIDKELLQGQRAEYGKQVISELHDFLGLSDSCSALSPSSISNSPVFINIGTGKEKTIRGTANLISEIVSFNGETIYDADKPDGTLRKLLDTSRINSKGWRPTFTFRNGLENAYSWYLSQAKMTPRSLIISSGG